MTASARKFVVGLLLFLGAGAVVGWLYDKPLVGLAVAALVALFWQVRQLLTFERALQTRNFDEFRVGEGIWQQIFSRFQFEQDKGQRRKSSSFQELRAAGLANVSEAVLNRI